MVRGSCRNQQLAAPTGKTDGVGDGNHGLGGRDIFELRVLVLSLRLHGETWDGERMRYWCARSAEDHRCIIYHEVFLYGYASYDPLGFLPNRYKACVGLGEHCILLLIDDEVEISRLKFCLYASLCCNNYLLINLYSAVHARRQNRAGPSFCKARLHVSLTSTVFIIT